MSTAFIALFLFGLSLPIAREFSLVTTQLTGNVEVQVYLSDPVNRDTVGRLSDRLLEVGGCPRSSTGPREVVRALQELFENQPIFTENTLLRDPHIPADPPGGGQPFLRDAARCEVVVEDDGDTHQECAEPGVRHVADYQELLDRLDSITRVLSLSVFDIAAIMLARPSPWWPTRCGWGCSPDARRSGSCASWAPPTGDPRAVPDRGAGRGPDRGLLRARGPLPRKGLLVDSLRGTAPWLPPIKNSTWFRSCRDPARGVLVAVVAGTVGMRRFLDV